MFHLNRINRRCLKIPQSGTKSLGLCCLSYKYIPTTSGFQGTFTFPQTAITWRNLLQAQQKYKQLAICTAPDVPAWLLRPRWGAATSVRSLRSQYVPWRESASTGTHIQIFAWKTCWILSHRLPGSCMIILTLPQHPKGKNISRINTYSPTFFQEATSIEAGIHAVFQLLLFYTIFFFLSLLRKT